MGHIIITGEWNGRHTAPGRSLQRARMMVQVIVHRQTLTPPLRSAGMSRPDPSIRG